MWCEEEGVAAQDGQGVLAKGALSLVASTAGARMMSNFSKQLYSVEKSLDVSV